MFAKWDMIAVYPRINVTKACKFLHDKTIWKVNRSKF